jgi:hypothetical protein
MSRAAWGADESWRFTNGGEDWPCEYWPTQALTVHHTGFAASADAAETVRTIYRQQALTSARGGIQGWGDIGYNLLIDADGVVYEGRYSGSQYPIFAPADRLMTTGRHVLYYNTGNIGVCLLGYSQRLGAHGGRAGLARHRPRLPVRGDRGQSDRLGQLLQPGRPAGRHPQLRVCDRRQRPPNWAATDCPATRSTRCSAASGNASPTPGRRPRSHADDRADPDDPADAVEHADRPTDGQRQPDGHLDRLAVAEHRPAPAHRHPADADRPPEPAAADRRHACGAGGDEYVQVARVEKPAEFPTVAPSPTPTPTADPTVTATPSEVAWPTWTPTASAGPQTSAVQNSEWNVAAAALGLTLAGGALGTVGRWWLRRRRLTTRVAEPAVTLAEPQPAAPAEPSTVASAETSTQDAAVEVPTQPSPEASTVDESSTMDKAAE